TGSAQIWNFSEAVEKLPSRRPIRRLSTSAGSRGLLFAAALKVIAQSPPSNAAPVANAGPDQTISLPDQATLRGWAIDDGLPNPPANLTYHWSLLNGPGAVNFGNPAAASTTVAFSAEGNYSLRLTAFDGESSGMSDVGVTVEATPTPTPTPTETPTPTP